MASTVEGDSTLQSELQKQLLAMLEGGQAHVDFDTVVTGLPVEMLGVRPDRVPYSAWQLLEHIRITQQDILESSTNRGGAGYRKLQWPEEYWPKESAPPSADVWEQSADAIRSDREAFEALLRAEGADLITPFPWGDGQTLLREALVVANHTAYHLGELVLVRRLLGMWEQEVSQ